MKAPVERVFAAWTLPEQILRWWGPRPVTCCSAEIDLRVGGSYRIGNLLPDGRVLFIFGEFEAMEPPNKLVYSWHVQFEDGEVAESSRVSVRFEARGQSTEVIVVHERIESEAIQAEHEHGWNGCLDNLEALFAAA